MMKIKSGIWMVLFLMTTLSASAALEESFKSPAEETKPVLLVLAG